MKLRLLALAILVASGSPALARPGEPLDSDRPARGDSLDALKDAVGEARMRSERDPELVPPSEARDLARELDMSRSLADRLPDAARRDYLEAAGADARRISESLRAADRSSYIEGRWSLFNLNRQSEAASGGYNVVVSVFTLDGLRRVGGYEIRAHRVGNPDHIRTFDGLTKTSAPTASRELLPGSYRFIARLGSREVGANREIEPGRPAQEIELPLQ